MALEGLHRFCALLRRGDSSVDSASEVLEECLPGHSATLAESATLLMSLSALRRAPLQRAFQCATHREGELSADDVTLGLLPMLNRLLGLHSEAEVVVASRSIGECFVRASPHDEQGEAFLSGAHRLVGVDAYARCQGVPYGVVDRMYAVLDHEMRGYGVPVRFNPVYPERGSEPLVSCTVVLHSEQLPISFTGHGRIKRPAEEVGRAVARRAKRFLKSRCDLPGEYLPAALVAFAVIDCISGGAPAPLTVDRTAAEVRAGVQQLFGDVTSHSVAPYNHHSSQLSFRR